MYMADLEARVGGLSIYMKESLKILDRITVPAH